jgi:integrase/recombinase XerC
VSTSLDGERPPGKGKPVREQLIADFFTYCKAARYAMCTAKRMRRDVRRLLRYLDERGLRPEELKPADAQGFQGFLVEQGRRDGKAYAEGSVGCILKAANAFYEYMKAAGRVFSNPFKVVKRIKVPKKIPANMLKEKEMSALLEELSRFYTGKNIKERVHKYKTHVISELMYSTGMRIEEVSTLTPSDVDSERGIVTVEQGKGGRRRECFLSEYAKEVLRLYVTEFHGLLVNGLSDTALLFGVTSDALGKLVNRELRQTCQELKIHPITSHGFRHSLGLHLLRSGCDIRHIAQILGHERLKNTEIYTRVDKEDLKSVLDTCHPRRFIKTHEDVEQPVGACALR